MTLGRARAPQAHTKADRCPPDARGPAGAALGARTAAAHATAALHAALHAAARTAAERTAAAHATAAARTAAARTAAAHAARARHAAARTAAVLVAAALLGACDRPPEPHDRPRRAGPAGEAPEASAARSDEPAAGATADPDEAGAAPLAGRRGPVRLDLDLAARLVLRIAEVDAHLDVERIDARTIRVEARTADVAALEALCTDDAPHCEDAIDAWAERLARPVDTATASSLAAVLVPRAEVEAARASAREAGLPEPIVGRPWVEPFFLAIVHVEPDVLRQLEPPDLVALGGRDVAALEALAVENLRTHFLEEEATAMPHEPASAEHAPNVRAVRAIDGLSTSRLLLPERWAGLAGDDGTLLVAVPSAHTILFTASAAPFDLAALAYLARRLHAAESAPVSPAILRLRAGAWALETGNDRPDPVRDAPLEALYGATGE